MTRRSAARRVTATDVAREAGVSQATVSYVLNDAPGQAIPEPTRRRVREAVERLGYAPHAAARALRTGRSDVVLLVLPDWPLGSALAAIVEGLTRGLEERDLTLLVRRSSSDRPLGGVWRAVTPAAVVSMEGVDERDRRSLADHGIPLVSAPLRPQTTAEGALATSHPSIGALQLQHLAATGHRRTGYATSADPRVAAFRDLRLDGVRTAAFELGLPEPSVREVDLDPRSAAAAVRAWREESPAVTAVCAYDDEVAFALLAGLRRLGLSAPGDLAVIGVDDVPLAPLAAPPLTTIRQDTGALVAHLTLAVLRAVAGEDPPAPPRSEAFSLVVRESA